MPKLKGLLDTARAKLTGLLGDFPAGFNSGAAAGFPGWAGDMAYMADTARLALTGADQQAAPEDYIGTTEYIAKQAGFPVPQTLSGQLGAAVGGLMSPGPGDLAKFAPLGAMFLGAKAKTAMPDVLEYAQAMEKAGKSADEIWQTTGKLGQPWFKGADGKWRFEIDDSRAFLNDDALIRSEDGYEAGVSEVMSHPQLAESYAFPERFATTTNAYESPLGMVVAGNYRPTELTLDFSPHQYAAMDEGVRGVVDPKQDSVFLHELQHSVQQREGFGQGGNPDQMASEYARAKNKWIAYSDAAQLYREAVNNYGGNLDKAAKAIREAGLDADQDMVNLVSQLGESVLQREAEASAQLNAMRDPFSSKTGDIGLDLYKRLAGEAEARNVQSRMNLTMDERIALPPWATQDVPAEQQIVRFGDGPAMAIEDFAARRAGKAKPYREAMGLPMDEASRMQRASEQGYNTDVYHGTADDVTAFDPAKFGASTGAHSAKQGVWTVSDPTTAAGYAQYAANDAKIKALMDEAGKWEKRGNWDKYDEAIAAAEELEVAQRNADWMGGQNVMPLKVRGKYLEQDMGGAEFVDAEKDIKGIIARAKREGYDGVKLNNLADDVGRNARPATHVLTFDPKNIRAKTAAFDPAKKDSANLLAGAAATALGLGLAKQQLSEQERRNGM